MARTIVLTGFMATGKSTVGRVLARRLGSTFVDTDVVIEERHGPIPEIFARQGEAAFRDIERTVAAELAGRPGLVVATGGRLMLDPANVATLGRDAEVVCLAAGADAIVARLRADTSGIERPLLAGDDPGRRVRELLAERAEGYGRFPQIDTEGRPPEAIADEIIAGTDAGPDLRALYDAATYGRGAPHDAIDRLRERGPVVWVPEPALNGWPAGSGYWAVLGHRETKEVLRDAGLFSSHLGGTQLRNPATEADLAFVRRMMLNQDPPEHSRIRGLLSSAFVPRAVAAIEAEVTTRARALVAAVADRGRCDLVSEVVGDLPVAVLAAVLGVPEQDRGLLYDWSNRVIGYQDPDYAASSSFDPATGTDMARLALAQRPGPGPDGSPPDPRTRAGLADLYAYAHALADHKRAHPGNDNDIMSLLLQARYEGTGLSNEEFETLFFLFAVAGNETLRNGIPGGLLTLIEHPDSYELLLARPELLPGAVEEMLRFWPPVIHFRRTATADCELGGRAIRAGDKVAVYHLAANRDPAVFPDPHRFDITRTDNDHVSFGFGPHFCLGAHLARAQMRAMIGEVLTQLGRVELDGEPVRLRSNFQQGLKSLPVRWAR